MPADIVRASASLLTHVADPAARSIVLGCCAAAVLGALRVKNLTIRNLVWRGILVAALAMPLLGLLVIPVRVPANALRIASYVSATTPATTAMETKTAPETHYVAATSKHLWLQHAQVSPQSKDARANVNDVAATVITDFPEHVEITTAPVSLRQQIPWGLLAAAIYLTMTIVLFTRFWLGIRFADKLEKNAVTVDDGPTLSAAARAACASGLRTVPRLAESEMLSVPVTLGVRSPVILFPAEWRGWEAGELEAVLAHEISHIARRDALLQRLAMIHRAIFWFSPFAWWLERHLSELSEQASDEAALAAGVDRTRYAETLLGFFATLEAAPQRVWWQGVSMAQLGQAERRVDRILAWRGAMSKGLTKSLMVGLAIIAAPTVILTASVHPMVNNFQDPIVEPEQQAPVASAARPSPTVPPQAPATPLPSTSPAANDDALPAQPPDASIVPIAAVQAETPVAAIAPVAPMAPLGWEGQVPVTPPAMDSNSDEVREAYEAVQRAQEVVIKAKDKADKAQVKAAKAASEAQVEAAKEAKSAYKKAITSYKENLKQYYACVAEAREVAKEARDIGGVRGGIYGGVYGGVSGGVGSQSYIYNHASDWGPRFVIVTKNSSDVTMSGTEEDAEHARSLKNKISGDFIWFERDEKSYIITDSDFISKAKALFAPQEELAKKQDELGRQQDELGRQQDALGKQMDEVKVKIPDITPDLERVRSELDALRHQDGASQRELGRLQSELGQLQSEVGRYQSDAGRQQGDIGRQQGDLGRKQGELGRQQGELGRQQGELARKASRELREMFSNAVDKGIAKPE